MNQPRAKRRRNPVALAVFFVATMALSAEYRVASPSELADIRGELKPGDVVLLAEGTHTDQHYVFTGAGSAERPITLRAETPGKTILNGSSRLSIGGEHLVVEGLLFRGGALDGGSIIEFQAPGASRARRCVLRDTTIIDYNPREIGMRYFWVSLHGEDNTVEHCAFSGQNHSGVTLCVWLEDGAPARHVIRRNHFANRAPGDGNGFETVRVGTGKHRLTNARCEVVENLFESCDGEIEIISNKSCENIYARNTFLNSAGCLTLRNGHRCQVLDNVFIGGEVEGAGGVRVVGSEHRISGNFFAGTKGRAGGAIFLQAGTRGEEPGGYLPVVDCLIDGNTFVDNLGSLFALNEAYGSKGCVVVPEGVIITNNLMVKTAGAKSLIVNGGPPAGVVWENNVLVGSADAEPPEGVEQAHDVPPRWKSRLQPRALTPNEVGPRVPHLAKAKRP